MSLNITKNTSEKLTLDTTGLTEDQLRLIKSINTMLTHVMSTDSEKEYFSSSSELLRLIAIAVKKSNFSKENKESGIDYEKQVLEYCADALVDQIHDGKLLRFDN